MITPLTVDSVRDIYSIPYLVVLFFSKINILYKRKFKKKLQLETVLKLKKSRRSDSI